MQKSLPCANALATRCGWTQTHIIDDRGEGRTYNIRFGNMAAGRCSFGIGSLLGFGSGRRFLIWLWLLTFTFFIFIGHRLRADDFQIPPHRQSVSTRYK